MIAAIPEFCSFGKFSTEESATMQLVFMMVCANHHIAPNDLAARKMVADAILIEFELSQHDIDCIKSAAIIAAKEATRTAGGASAASSPR